MINNLCTIYVNKKPYKVSYLIYLCHMTGKFNKFESLDVYSKFFNEFRFDTTIDISNYLFSLDIVKTSNTNFTILKGSNFLQFRNLILKGGLFYVYLLNVYFTFLFNKQNKYLKQPKKFSVKEILNTGLNYIHFNTEDKYKLLFPYLKFYKVLSMFTIDEYISINYIGNTLTYLDIKVDIEDIEKGLSNHGIILPYKNNYIWSSNLLLDQLKNIDNNIINLFCLDLMCTNLFSNI